MNILFYCDYKVSPLRGGTERVTLLLSDTLHDVYGCRCHCLYAYHDEKYPAAEFSGGMSQLPSSHQRAFLRQYIEENSIDVIVIQSTFGMAATVRQALPEGSKCRIIMMHHFAPAWETHNCTLANYRNVLRQAHGLRRLWYTLKCLLTPLFRLRDISRLRQMYHSAYEAADRVVLLSENFKPEFMQFGRITDESKFAYLPNMLSLDFTAPADKEQYLSNKTKEVLIVSRLEEGPKRISLALDIWKAIKQSGKADGWTLKIVGEGPDASSYRSKAERENIPDVSFEGHQNPLEYYKRASIFMMTSRSEAWGLTLTESQQCGVVPVVIDSFASLTDIITHGEDGIIVPSDESSVKERYATAVLELINDTTLRHRLAINGMKNVQRFNRREVADKFLHIVASPCDSRDA